VRYRELKMPTVIVTGADDKIADVGRQSERLCKAIPQSRFVALPGLGHMVHHLAPDEVMKAVERAFLV
jgi:pimeloyl-ACP methyl ester carboxylesterase